MEILLAVVIVFLAFIVIPVLLISIIIALLKPSVFKFLLKEKMTRKNLIITFSSVLVFLIFVIIVGIIRLSGHEIGENTHETKIILASTTSPSASNSPEIKTSQVLSETPYERIQTIVSKYGEEAEIYDRNSNMTREYAKPPFDVMIITETQSCASAKLRAWDITRDLFTDKIAAPNIERVKVMITRYVSTSLGSEHALKMTPDMWKVGSSIFFDALQAESTHEVFSNENTPISEITFGVEQELCQD